MWMSDAAIVFATLVGPVLAIQAQKAVERRDSTANRKMAIFESLMATRMSRLSPEHVKALNMIDLTFYGSVKVGQTRRTENERAVLAAWREYLDHLAEPVVTDPAAQAIIGTTREELFINLLAAIAKERGFDFDRVQLKKGAYSPLAYEKREQRLEAIGEGLTAVLNGKQKIAVEVTAPVSPSVTTQ